MSLWEKNISVLSQKKYYDFPNKKPVSIALGVLWVIIVWLFFQTLPPLIYNSFINRGAAQDNTYFLLAALGNCLAATAVYFFFIRKEKKYHPIVIKKMAKKECASAVFFVITISVVISVIVDVISYFSGMIKTDASVENLMSMSLPVQILMSVISAAIAEELLLRYCIQNRLMGNIDNIWAIVITAVIFGLIHGNVSQLITASVAGIAHCFVYAKSRSLRTVILAHMLNNLLACLQSDFVSNNPGEPIYWIFSISVLVISIILAIPFIKGDAAVTENHKEPLK